nr:hypothetical protein CFP56_19832 [Quercus suber]
MLTRNSESDSAGLGGIVFGTARCLLPCPLRWSSISQACSLPVSHSVEKRRFLQTWNTENSKIRMKTEMVVEMT